MAALNRTFLEFFAGGGMARAGLGKGWECTFANDFDPMKAATYAANWGAEHLVCEDVAKLRASQLSGQADLAWASFPCQDLSLAGSYLGLGNATSSERTRSGTFWPFWALMRDLKREGRAPRMVVLENVFGALTSRDGKDFSAICEALASSGYRFGAVVMDAALFVPQSRQRVFFVAIDSSVSVSPQLVSAGPSEQWHPKALLKAHSGLSKSTQQKWLWWSMRAPLEPSSALVDFIEDTPSDVPWHTAAETQKLLAMMSPLHKAKVLAAQQSGARAVGCLYKRTRTDERGNKCQRAEVRFDGVAGCLRTPGGGSSRQVILVINGRSVRSRLLSPREAARLMGLPDTYKLPARYNDAYHVAGDGVCVNVVRHLAKVLLEPLSDAPVLMHELYSLA
jgi:DNA (cytosine-5)-methyltransferase 1